MRSDSDVRSVEFAVNQPGTVHQKEAALLFLADECVWSVDLLLTTVTLEE